MWKRSGRKQNLTRWRCTVSYSQELGVGHVADWIQNRNSLVLCIREVNNWSGRGDWAWESEGTTNIKNEIGDVLDELHLESWGWVKVYLITRRPAVRGGNYLWVVRDLDFWSMAGLQRKPRICTAMTRLHNYHIPKDTEMRRRDHFWWIVEFW